MTKPKIKHHVKLESSSAGPKVKIEPAETKQLKTPASKKRKRPSTKDDTAPTKKPKTEETRSPSVQVSPRLPEALHGETWRQYIMLRAYCALWPDFQTLMFIRLKRPGLPAAERHAIEQLKAASVAMEYFWFDWSRRLRAKFAEAGDPMQLELVELAMCSVSMSRELVIETQSTKREYRLQFKLSAHAFYERQRWRIAERMHKWMGTPGPQTWATFLERFKADASAIEARVFTVKHAALQPLLQILSFFKTDDCLAWHIHCWTEEHRDEFNEARRIGSSHPFHHDTVPRLGSQFPFQKIHKRLLDYDRWGGSSAGVPPLPPA